MRWCFAPPLPDQYPVCEIRYVVEDALEAVDRTVRLAGRYRSPEHSSRGSNITPLIITPTGIGPTVKPSLFSPEHSHETFFVGHRDGSRHAPCWFGLLGRHCGAENRPSRLMQHDGAQSKGFKHVLNRKMGNLLHQIGAHQVSVSTFRVYHL